MGKENKTPLDPPRVETLHVKNYRALGTGGRV